MTLLVSVPLSARIRRTVSPNIVGVPETVQAFSVTLVAKVRPLMAYMSPPVTVGSMASVGAAPAASPSSTQLPATRAAGLLELVRVMVFIAVSMVASMAMLVGATSTGAVAAVTLMVMVASFSAPSMAPTMVGAARARTVRVSTATVVGVPVIWQARPAEATAMVRPLRVVTSSSLLSASRKAQLAMSAPRSSLAMVNGIRAVSTVTVTLTPLANRTGPSESVLRLTVRVVVKLPPLAPVAMML